MTNVFIFLFIFFYQNVCSNRCYCLLFCFFIFKNESAGIAASIDAMAVGEDGHDLSGNGSKNAADESPSVRLLFS